MRARSAWPRVNRLAHNPTRCAWPASSAAEGPQSTPFASAQGALAALPSERHDSSKRPLGHPNLGELQRKVLDVSSPAAGQSGLA